MILIALGANLPSSAGPPDRTLRAALARLAANGARPVAVSRFFSTPAWPDPSDPSFVNAVAMIETELSPAALMALLADTELAFGRERKGANAPRTLDLDLIDYEGRNQSGALILPHPRVEQRAFVLVPIADIVPSWHHPLSGRPVGELIDALPPSERDAVRPYYPPALDQESAPMC